MRNVGNRYDSEIMLAESTSIGLTEIIAGYAAIVATVVLIWDIYKWKASGPRIKLTAKSNRKFINVPHIPEGKSFIVADATNVGNLPTTITALGAQYYKSWLRFVLQRPEKQFDIVNTGLKSLPYTLEPGKVWKGVIEQNEEINRFIKSGILICVLCLSHSRKPKTAWIR